jgi:predicted Zn-dependent protease
MQAARHKRVWLLGGAFLLVAAVSALVWFESRRAQKRAGQQAIRLAQTGRFSDAEPKLRAALEHDPDNGELLRALALGLLAAQRLDDAEEVLGRWCEAQPREAGPYRFRMDLRHGKAQLLKAGDDQQRLQRLALDDGRQVLELDPTDESTAQKVIWLYLGMGRFEDADRLCRRQRERQTQDPALLYLHARALHGLGASGEAQGLLDALLSRTPQFLPAVLLRAVLHYEADEADRAIPLLRKVIAEDAATRLQARYLLALALGRAGHAEEARQLMAEVQREHFELDTAGHQPSTLAMRVRRAELLFNVGRAAEALAAVQAVLAEDPKCAAAHRLLASHYDQQGESTKAGEHRRQAELHGARDDD